MPLRLRLTGEALRLTGPRPGAPFTRPPPPSAQVLLTTDSGELLVTERGEHLTLGASPDGQ
jgi:hypothetical protein